MDEILGIFHCLFSNNDSFIEFQLDPSLDIGIEILSSFRHKSIGSISPNDCSCEFFDQFHPSVEISKT